MKKNIKYDYANFEPTVVGRTLYFPNNQGSFVPFPTTAKEGDLTSSSQQTTTKDCTDTKVTSDHEGKRKLIIDLVCTTYNC